jgi:hypothetical protein
LTNRIQSVCASIISPSKLIPSLSFADEPRQALRSAAAGNDSQIYFRLSETRFFARQRISQASASSQPPPRQKPFIIAITGFGNESSELKSVFSLNHIALLERRFSGKFADVRARDKTIFRPRR